MVGDGGTLGGGRAGSGRSSVLAALGCGLLLLTAAGCGGGPPSITSAVAPEFDAEAKRQCKAGSPTLKPLVIEWPSTDRAELEAVAQGQVVAVRYEACSLRVIATCKAPGTYGYRPVTPKRDDIRIRTVDELRANIPVYGFKFEANLASSGELRVDTLIVGRFETAASQLGLEELEGNCDGATHFVRALVVGAFDFHSGASSSVSGELGAMGVGVGGARERSNETLLRDGSAAACEKAASSDASPPYGCGALVRLELVPLGDAARIGAAPEMAGISNPYRAGNLQSLATACEGGHGPSCATLGEMYETPIGTSKDDAKARSLYDKACRLGSGEGCSLLGSVHAGGTAGSGVAPEKIAELLREGCEKKSAYGCLVLAGAHFEGHGVPRDLRRYETLRAQAFTLAKASCEARNAGDCLLLAHLYRTGSGVPKNVERAVFHLRELCDADLGAACAGEADIIHSGEAGPRDRPRVVELLSRGCKARDYEVCKSAGDVLTNADASNADVRKGIDAYSVACEAGVADACLAAGM